MTHVLFVCTGNTCRSPMAEMLFNDMALRRGIGALACSAGIRALGGMSISQNAKIALQEQGIDASEHAARQLTPQLVNTADRIFCMSAAHASAVKAIAPTKDVRVLGDDGIPDPYGLPLHNYEDTLESIKEAIADILDTIEKEDKTP